MNSEHSEVPLELERLLGARGATNDGAQSDSALSDSVLSDLGFADLKAQVAAADRSWLGRLRAFSTPTRRLVAFLSFGIIVGLKLMTGHRPDLGDYPPLLLAVYLGSLGVLLAIAMVAALRPLHLPPLRTSVTITFTALTIIATCVLAVAPGFHDHASVRVPGGVSLWQLGGPCFLFGLVIGLPVYVVLRILDRGNPLGRLLAASAAGLTGNMMLELHCPVGGANHLLAGHAMVLVVFVLGVVAAEWFARIRRAS